MAEPGADATAVPAAGDVAATSTPEVEYPFTFHGNAREYFRIWIVNLALSIATIGIFSAWAKVRRERYFYGNTWVAGAPFEYLADPINILKGRVIAVSVLTAYVVSGQFVPLAQSLLVLVVLIATPWLLLSALRFRARYSAWNTLTFRFAGRLSDAVRFYLAYYVLMVPTLGLIYPYIRFGQRRFVIDGHRFGGHSLQFGGTARDFYRIYGVALALFFGVVIGAALVYGIVAGVMKALDVPDRGPVGVTQILMILPLYGTLFCAWTFVESRVTNLAYNTMTLGTDRFRSTVRARDLLRIYVTNTLAILASVGLLVPWAQVRLARYRADHLVFFAAGDVGDLLGETALERSAVGAETAGVFDLDLSL